MTEIWKPIPGYGGHYEASSLGRVRVLERTIERMHPRGKLVAFKYKEKVLRPSRADKYGHLSVCLGVDGTDRTAAVHRLVLLSFVGPCPVGMEACHGNGDAGDNRPGNLRWDTHASNNGDRAKHGTYAVGEKHPMAKLSAAGVDEIRASELPLASIAKLHGISKSQVSRIRRGTSWPASGLRKLDEMDLLANTIAALNN